MRVSADFSLGHDAEHVIDQDVQLVARADLHTEQDYGLVQAQPACRACMLTAACLKSIQAFVA